MSDHDARQRLAAILAADAVGYSRLMRADEASTMAMLEARRAAFRTCTTAETGRIVDTAGDSVLAVFESAAGAVRAALSIQKDIAAANAELADDHRMTFRIGVHLGDVMEKADGTIYGDGVNIAARLESLAGPGGSVISDVVHSAVRGRVNVDFADLGPQTVKNFADPIHPYRALGVGDAPAPSESTVTNPENADAGHGVGIRPVVAVLPFDNLSGDPEQEYFSDGISEDIITALSHVRQFFVIARNTTFTYKGQAVDVQAVAKELGVNYVLEGSVRRAGNRVRITAQLIDGNSGNHLWAEKYDRDIADIFEVQDDITQTVVGAIEPELYRAEQDRARRKPSENLDAWDLCQQGVWHSWHDTMDHSLAARRLLREAIELDPEICLAHAFLAFALWRAVVFHLTENPREAMDEALMAGKRAIDLDQGNAHAHWAMGAVYMHQCEHELARAELASAIRINPSFANAYQYLGWTMAYDGEPEEGIRQVQMAQRLSPNDPMAWGMILIQAQAHLNMKDFAKAEQMARQAKLLTDNLPIKCALLAAMGHTGNLDDAPALIEQVLAIVPEFTVSKITDIFPFKHQADIDTWVEGLRRAGVPEE